MHRHKCTNVWVTNEKIHVSYKQYRGKRLHYVPRLFLLLFIFHYKGYTASPNLFSTRSEVDWCELGRMMHALPIMCIHTAEHRVPCVSSLWCRCKSPMLLSPHGVRFIAAEVPRTTSACYNRAYLFTYTSRFFVASTTAMGLVIPVSSRLCFFLSV